MARARRLLWLGAFAGIVYLVWRWRQQAELPDHAASGAAGPSAASLSPQSAVPAPASLGGPEGAAPAPRRIPTRVHRGAPPVVSLGDAPSVTMPDAPTPDAPPDDPEPTAPPAAAEVFREVAIGADAPTNELEPSLPDGEPPPPLMDLASLVGPDVADSVDLASAVSPKAAAGELLDLAPLVGPAADSVGIIGLTNLNSADADALIALPGIGPAIARRIIAYRKQHGPFTNVEQLIDIQGIGTRNIDEFRHLVTIA